MFVELANSNWRDEHKSKYGETLFNFIFVYSLFIPGKLKETYNKV
jgi:hypothetical protein